MSNKPPTVKQYQENPYSNYARKVAIVESGNNPKAKNPYSSAGGLYQFTTGTFEGVNKKYKLGYTAEDRFDPVKSQKAFELFTKENEAIVAPVVGRELNDADRYLAHFLGGSGASNFLQGLQANPNAPVNFSEAVIKANKNVLLNKDGSRKTNQQVYNWAENKMSITPDKSITPQVTNFEVGAELPNFAPEIIDFTNLSPTPQEETVEPNTNSKVEQAKGVLTQKQNEQDLIDYIAQLPSRVQPQQIAEVSAAPQTNILEQYAQISQLVENPILQEGGQIPISSLGMYEYPNQPVVVPTNGSITMESIQYPILAKSLETNEQKVLLPDMNYFFNNTQNVLEIPLTNGQ